MCSPTPIPQNIKLHQNHEKTSPHQLVGCHRPTQHHHHHHPQQDQGKSASYRLTPALHNLQLLPDPLYPLHALYLLHPPTVPTIHSLHQLYPYPQYPLYPQLHFTHYTSYTHHHSSSLYFRPRSTAIIQPALAQTPQFLAHLFI